MKYTVLTLFPEITDAFFATSIMAKAIARGIIEYRAINIRDFALDRHKTCDDAPYGGGPGMLMLPEPLGRALEAAGIERKGAALPEGAEPGGEGGAGRGPGALRGREPPLRGCPPRRGGAQDAPRAAGAGGEASPLPFPIPKGGKMAVCLSPSGRRLDQALARELAGLGELVLVCGRYEGIDQRVIDLYIDEEVSVGDYVLSSGEVAALALIDATYRLVGEVIAPGSLREESFSGGLLEYPQYTRPEIYGTMRVPEALLSGHHENIRRWRLERRVERTLRSRPDLILRGREAGAFDAETSGIIGRLLPAEGARRKETEDERD